MRQPMRWLTHARERPRHLVEQADGVARSLRGAERLGGQIPLPTNQRVQNSIDYHQRWESFGHLRELLA